MKYKKLYQFFEKYIDSYGDCYLTHQNLRYSIKENVKMLIDCVENGDMLYQGDNGYLLITGFSDNAERKYIKIITEDLNSAKELLNQAKDIEENLWIKLKNHNPMIKICEECGFKKIANRGKEILMCRLNKDKKC